MSGRVGVEQTPDIETVLAAHGLQGDTARVGDWAGQCDCGEKFYATGGSEWAAKLRVEEAHRAHVADRLAAAVREARAAELREAAIWMRDNFTHGSGWVGDRIAYLLHDRADRIAVDAPDGGEGR